ncbi:ribonuclease Z [Candidatus Woesearchaeota archaeon]|nr:MAG: ribonuclease Z [Candidatus Woesearchaeota archaeon]
MKIVFLGTTCMVPTKERNHYSIYAEYDGQGILFDCGEGTQRQMKITGIKPSKISKIFISHWHGDHVLGIPGLLQTMGANQYEGKLQIFGPKGTKEKIMNMFKVFIFDNKIELEVIDIEKDGIILNTKDYLVETYKLEHSVETYGYKFIEKDKINIDIVKTEKIGLKEGPVMGKLQRGEDIEFEGKKYKNSELTKIKKGKVLGIISDTRFTSNCYKIAENADLLISEASYGDDKENKAEEYFHLTSKQAGLIASNSNVKKLILTHFSQRYTTTSELEEEARTVFDNTVCAYDFMKTNL